MEIRVRLKYNDMRIDEIRKLKRKIRKEIQDKLRGQSPSLREERSRAIQEKVVSSDSFRSAGTVMSYISLAVEVKTDYLNKKALEGGKRLVVPFIDVVNRSIIPAELKSMDGLVEGPYGILEPKDGFCKRVAAKEIDLVIVPAIAFDKSNSRLGRGKGYYDRFLASGSLASAKRIGLAFRFQIVESIPTDPHDVPVSEVITE